MNGPKTGTPTNAEIHALLEQLAQSERDREAHYKRWPLTAGELFPGGDEQRSAWRQLCSERDRIIQHLTDAAVLLYPST